MGGWAGMKSEAHLANTQFSGVDIRWLSEAVAVPGSPTEGNMVAMNAAGNGPGTEFGHEEREAAARSEKKQNTRQRSRESGKRTVERWIVRGKSQRGVGEGRRARAGRLNGRAALLCPGHAPIVPSSGASIFEKRALARTRVEGRFGCCRVVWLLSSGDAPPALSHAPRIFPRDGGFHEPDL